MTCGIYKIQNKINGKVYIGQSINIERRWKDHKKCIHGISEGYNYPIYRAIRLYGLENFDWKIIEECSKEELDDKEKFYIKDYNCVMPFGYNQTFGGQDNFTHPMKLTYDKVIEIKMALKETKETGSSLAKRYGVTKDTITSINVGRSWYEEGIEYPIRPMTFLYCQNCGARMNSSNKYGLCYKCYDKIKRRNNLELEAEKELRSLGKNNDEIEIELNIFTREKLKKLIRAKTFTEIGKMYNITDSGVKKWCKKYKLPHLRSDIEKMSDEEWEKI